MAILKRYFPDPAQQELFGANITLRWQGKGGALNLSLVTRFPDGSAGPSLAQTINLADSLTGPTEMTFDLGPGRWNGLAFSDVLLDARVLVTNTSVPGVPQVIYDSGWMTNIYQVVAYGSITVTNVGPY